MSDTHYTKWRDYHGGGSILNEYTTLRNVVSECAINQLSDDDVDEVFRILRKRGEVIILNGEIKAAQWYDGSEVAKEPSPYAFKRYVHERLDEAGVPVDPCPTKTAHTGCRIGNRLDWILLRHIETQQP